MYTKSLQPEMIAGFFVIALVWLLYVFSIRLVWIKCFLSRHNLNGQKSVALDAALRLFSIYHPVGKAETAQVYQQFLVRDAKNVPYWIKFNKVELEALGLPPEQTNRQDK